MAPIKRTRDLEETVEVVESASSNFRRNNQKRPRLSAVGRSVDEEALDLLDNSGGEEAASTQRRLGSNRENYERERDEVSENEDDGEAAVERATQDIRRHKQSQAENQAAEAGVIESIECLNFMCHERLEIKLGPLINFIIGHNGSGKSAVLTALTLCLGGKATATNRGQSLKSFVKEGKETATLIVKIKNKGEQGFRQDKYGDSIIVERHFSIHGTSGFKLKSATGAIISTKRAELDDITDFYALQLDNPVNVLTQDMARQFLNSSTEADKYRFFIKGVQLEQLDNDYVMLTESLDNVDAQMENVLEDVKNSDKVYREAQHKFELSERQTTLRNRIGKLMRQMAWAQVEEQEDRLAQLERQIERTKAETQQRLEEEEAASGAYEEANRALGECQAQKLELESSLVPLKEQQSESKQRFDQNTQELLDLVTSQRTANESKKNESNNAEKRRGEIEEERRRLEAQDGGFHASKLAEIEEAESLVPEAKEKLERHEASKPRLDASLGAATKKVADIKEAIRRKREEVEAADRKLRDLQQRRPPPYAAYHPSIRNVMNAVRMERRFQQKPVGPFGEYIKLLKPEWSSILEKYFGGVLNNFVVTNVHDQKLLEDIIKRSGFRTTIRIGQGHYMDISHNEPDAKFDTIMRSLEFDNDLVRNQLIMNQKIENVILIKDRHEGHRVMFQQARPQCAEVCLSFNENTRGAGLRFAVGNGGQKSDPVDAWTGPARMQTDNESQIEIQIETVKGLKEELNSLEAEKRALETEWTTCKQAVTRHANDTRELTVAMQRAEDRVITLKEELEKATPMDGKLDVLKEELVKIQDGEKYYQRQIDESVDEKNRLDELARELKASLATADAQVEARIGEITKAEAMEAKLTDKRGRKLVAKNAAIARRESTEESITELESNRQDMAGHVESFVEQASIVGARVAVDRGETPRTLDAKLNNLNTQIRNFEREVGGNPEEISRKMTEAKARRDQVQASKREVEEMADRLRHSLSDRHFRWKRFRSSISTRARAGFAFLLSERDFKGRMLLDHRKKLLQLLVQPDSSRRGDEGRQTRTLSGGEKSYSTICLLLALWDAMGSPIRCLDEFDVFMDSVNRDVSMKMMIAAARGSVGRQFILITPQAMGTVNLAEGVKIIKMNDPERGQTVLAFAGAA